MKTPFLFKLFGILSIFMMSCCTIHINGTCSENDTLKEEKILNSAKLSAVKINVATSISLKDKILTSTKTLDSEIDSSFGSGSILKQLPEGTLILTAGHVCEDLSLKRILFHFPYYKENRFNVVKTTKYLITDISGNQYPAIMLSISHESDVCVLLTKKISQLELKLSSVEPRVSEKVYTINYPRGIWELGYNPIFSGYFIGNLTGEKAPSAAFTIPTAPGSSGGLIINLNGELIGMIHSYLSTFNEISLSATLFQINEILDNAIMVYNINLRENRIRLEQENKIFLYWLRKQK